MREKVKVAVIDDEEIQRETMKSLLENVAQMLNSQISVVEFSSGEEFLFEILDHVDIDILFLDIEMNQVDGLEVAKHVRKVDKDMTIVFVTGFAEYAVEGYEVQALDYLLKPIQLEKIIRVFERHLSKIPIVQQSIMLETPEGITKVALDNIVYIEANKRQCEIHLEDNSLTVNKRLKEISNEVNEDFIQTHRSYLVNARHMNRLLKTDVECSNGDIVPVSRRLAKEVQEKFIGYHKGSVFYED
jgi:DNA-binding LytR/AlgR family response regulator